MGIGDSWGVMQKGIRMQKKNFSKDRIQNIKIGKWMLKERMVSKDGITLLKRFSKGAFAMNYSRVRRQEVSEKWDMMCVLILDTNIFSVLDTRKNWCGKNRNNNYHDHQMRKTKDQRKCSYLCMKCFRILPVFPYPFFPFI